MKNEDYVSRRDLSLRTKVQNESSREADHPCLNVVMVPLRAVIQCGDVPWMSSPTKLPGAETKIANPTDPWQIDTLAKKENHLQSRDGISDHRAPTPSVLEEQKKKRPKERSVHLVIHEK